MLKKTITYTDYDGTERTEDFYFNLTEAEIVQMEMGINGGMKKMLEKIIQAQDHKKIMEVFTDLIFRSYGEKSLDGRFFVKNDELSKAFTQTEAYNKLFMELVTDSKAAADFFNNIIPKELEQKTAELKVSE